MVAAVAPPPGSPVAFETEFGWVLGGSLDDPLPPIPVSSHCTSITSLDDSIHKFWEIEEAPTHDSELSLEERAVVRHFRETHTRSDGRFIVALSKRPGLKPLGESRSQAIRRSFHLKGH